MYASGTGLFPGPSRDARYVRWTLTIITAVFFSLFLILPVVAVFSQALEKGLGAYFRALTEPETMAAVRLTLLVTAVAVPLNLVFGVLAAWAITKFNFPGKNALITLIDLPIAVSPIIAGMIFVLLYGSRGLAGPWLNDHGIQVIFAAPGIMLTTMFVTLPYIARELVPLMQAQGSEEEEAALTLGAKGLQTFLRVTLPNIRWGVLYGLILCTARAIGEFGAVSVVSGHIRGQTNTVPLHVEILYNEYNFAAAFAVASAMIILALVTLGAKSVVEGKSLRLKKRLGVTAQGGQVRYERTYQ